MLNGRFQVDQATGCWNWTGSVSGSGYGKFERGGKQVLAHRVAWETVNGPITGGAVIRHKCDNPRCVNPDHLLSGTVKQNAEDMKARGRSVAGRGQKLSTAAVQAIRVDCRLHREIAADHGVSRVVITKIKNNQIWRTV